MARPRSPVDYRLLYKVSELYYLQDQKQKEIADRLHLSRPHVSRLLRQARHEGIVQINVVSNDGFLHLETQLEKRYGLDEVLIVDIDPAAGERVLGQRLGASAAAYMQRTVTDGDVIGVTWGRTLGAMVSALGPQSGRTVQVVQTVGGLGPPEAKTHTTELSRRLAHLLGASLTLLPAPGVVDREESSAILRSDRYVRAALDRFSSLTTAFVGIGGLATNPVFERQGGTLPDGEYDALAAAGAVGDIAMRFFDPEGAPVRTSLDARTIGITLEELRHVPSVVGVAGGPKKVDAILGALRGGLIDVLITDVATADLLIAA